MVELIANTFTQENRTRMCCGLSKEFNYGDSSMLVTMFEHYDVRRIANNLIKS